MRYKNVQLMGTSHIAQESIESIRAFIRDEKPDIIALELDKTRLQGLMHPVKRKLRISDIFKIGFKGFLFSVIGAWAEKTLGKMVGVKPGSEMKEAVLIAQKEGIQLALIDQHIEKTLKSISATLTWKEKWHFVVDIVKAVVFRKPVITFDLRKVPSKKVINALLDQVRVRYPNLYGALLVKRNKVMALKLRHLMENYPSKKILALVGAAHEDGIMEILKSSS